MFRRLSVKTLHKVYNIGKRNLCDMSTKYNYETLKIIPVANCVLQVELNRPEKRNAMNRTFWREMVECFEQIDLDGDCRAVVLSGAGKSFTAGLDLQDFTELFSGQTEIEFSRKGFLLKKLVDTMQNSFTIIEKCKKPVIAAIHGACVGGGMDMITACDIRYSTKDAFFQIKEIDLGMAADVGTLQRFPKIVSNDSVVRELAYTGRRFDAHEAKEFGLVGRVFPDKETMLNAAIKLASMIASKSPVGVQGTKVNLIYSRDHNVPDSLNYISTWNASMLQSEDMAKAAVAGIQKEEPVFEPMAKSSKL